jgi:hypothetical protein
MRLFIRDKAAAQAIIDAYQQCRNCSDCILHTPEGWRCSYQYECAMRYLEDHQEDKI